MPPEERTTNSLPWMPARGAARRRLAARAGLVVAGVLLAGAGCNQGPFQSAQRQSLEQQQTYAARLQDLEQRIGQLDGNNRDLHAQLARSQQQLKLSQDQVALLQGRLSDTTALLRDSQTARQDIEQRIGALNASARQRGGATITANNSLQQSLELVNIPGLEVRQETDVIRIEVPADELFQPGTAQLNASSLTKLDQVADALARNYAKQRVAIETHETRGAASHQVSAQQAAAIMQQFTTRNRLPADQFFLVAMGANHPRYSTATAAGADRNRRVEFVVYPERWAKY